MCSASVLSSIQNQLKVSLEIQPLLLLFSAMFGSPVILHVRLIVSFSEEEEEESGHNWVFSADQMVVGGGGNV